MISLYSKLKYIIMCGFVFPVISFLIFSFIPQYEIRDHEGYLAGVILLAGYISLTIICNMVKREIFLCTKSRNNIYIVSITNTVALFVLIRAMLFYYARVYLFSLICFIGISGTYVVFRQICIKYNKIIKVNYITVICIAGIFSLLTTVVRGIYLLRWQVLMTLVFLVFTVCYEILLRRMSVCDIDATIFFPYDFASWKKEIISAFKKKYTIAIVITLSLAVMYLILGPLEIYAGNMLSFSFGYLTFVPLFIVLSFFVILILSCVISLFNEKTYKIICILLTAYSLLSYIQYMFMNTKLMEEDGARLRLDTMGNYPRINLILWFVIAAVIVTALYFIKDNWKAVAVYACAFITAVQLVAVVTLVVKCVNSPAPRYYQLTGEKMFTVAKDENVIVLMPDSFCRRYLSEALADDISHLDMFKDFTYYSNMDSEWHPTFPSVIHMITGYEPFTGMGLWTPEERVQWRTDAWNSETCKTFFESVSNEGYKFYMNIPSACELFGAYDDVKDYVENAEYAESNVDKVRLIKMLFSMSIYRCVPYVVKPPFEYFSWDFAELERYNGKVAAYKNEDFYAEVKQGITVDESVSKKIHVINWHGFHEEYTHDEFCNPVPNAEEVGITKLQNEKGALLCVKTYLEELKKAGRYDDSTIIVMGDHGKEYDGCVFVKLPGQKHDDYMAINNEAKYYSGFQQTILDLIGAPKQEILEPSWLD